MPGLEQAREEPASVHAELFQKALVLGLSHPLRQVVAAAEEEVAQLSLLGVLAVWLRLA